MTRRMKLRLPPTVVLLLAVAGMYPAPAGAGVVVLANRTADKIDFTVIQPDGKEQRHAIVPKDVLSIPVAEKIDVAVDTGGTIRRYPLPANSIHCFVVRDGKRDLLRLTLPGTDAAAAPAAAGRPQVPLCVVPVMLLVDQNEPAVQRVWEKRLRERLKEASDIFERCCQVRFEVVAVGTWQMNNATADFEKSLRDFEAKVTPAPARLAIGFTSYYRLVQGPVRMGGTRGPLGSHILIREWPNRVTKTERLEVLVHELGHFVGAVHSREDDSVMRPTLGDQRSHARDFRIGFDPLNTLAMYLLAEELRSRPINSLAELRPQTKSHLRAVYTALASTLPKDPAAPQYLALLEQGPRSQAAAFHFPQPLVEATQRVVQAITAAAQENARLPAASAGDAGGVVRFSGDRLTEYYIRRAAAAADRLPSDRAAKAFLLGLAIGLDHSAVLRNTPAVGELCRQIEPDQKRMERLSVLGSPTVLGRRDLAQHFVVSCGLTALVGGEAAETAGIGKELYDSQFGSGFSFVDLAADLAGTTFGSHVLEKKIPLPTLAVGFTVKDFLPEPADLREGIPWQEFREKYGSAADDRFYQQKKVVRQRILALPGYKTG